MRPFIPPLLLLVVLTSFVVWNSSTVTEVSGRLTDQLEQTDILADQGDWVLARRSLADSYADWQGWHRWLRMVAPHSTVDAVESMYCRARAFAETEELTEFRAEVAGLRSQLRQLAESERFLAENIF